MQTITLGAGYSVQTTHDACGCQLVISINRFDGLMKTIDEQGNLTLEYQGKPSHIMRFGATAKLPHGQREVLTTDTVECVELEEAQLRDWLHQRLLRHGRRSYTEAELIVAGTEERLIEIITDKTDAIMAYVEERLQEVGDLPGDLADIFDLLSMLDDGFGPGSAFAVGGGVIIQVG